MFKKILNYVKNEKVVSLGDIAEYIEKDVSIISDAISLLTTKGYLKNNDCCEIDQNSKNKCFTCPLKSNCNSNLLTTYEITTKGIQYSKKEDEKLL